MADWMYINKLLKQIDIVLTKDFLEGGEDNIVKALQCYDLACNDCNLELEEKIRNFLLLNQKLLIPVLKRYFSQRVFEMELDYLYFLLEKFNTETICAIKEDWLNYILELKVMSIGSYSYIFDDAYRILVSSNAASEYELKQLIEKSNTMI